MIFKKLFSIQENQARMHEDEELTIEVLERRIILKAINTPDELKAHVIATWEIGDMEMLSATLTKAFSVCGADVFGILVTSLHKAARYGLKDDVVLERDKAIQIEHRILRTIQILHEQGANVLQPNSNGKTAWDYYDNFMKSAHPDRLYHIGIRDDGHFAPNTCRERQRLQLSTLADSIDSELRKRMQQNTLDDIDENGETFLVRAFSQIHKFFLDEQFDELTFKYIHSCLEMLLSSRQPFALDRNGNGLFHFFSNPNIPSILFDLSIDIPDSNIYLSKKTREEFHTLLKLTSEKCNINTQNINGTTVLMQAIHEPSLVRYLLSKGADPKLTNKNGDNAFILAFKGNHQESMRLL